MSLNILNMYVTLWFGLRSAKLAPYSPEVHACEGMKASEKLCSKKTCLILFKELFKVFYFIDVIT